ncbi:hypothetical protein AAZX31_07G034100 [Glycine max]
MIIQFAKWYMTVREDGFLVNCEESNANPYMALVEGSYIEKYIDHLY